MIAIACVEKNLGIGLKNKLPWPPNKEDFEFFKSLTQGKTILVGRQTWLGLPNLKNRTILCVTSKYKSNGYNYKTNSAFATLTLQEFDALPTETKGGIIVAGGGQIYQKFVLECSELYLTVLEQEFEHDVKFPFDFNKLDTIFPAREKVKDIEGGAIYKYSKA